MKDYFNTTSMLRCILSGLPIAAGLGFFAAKHDFLLYAGIIILISIIGDMFGYIIETTKKSTTETETETE